MRHINTRRRRTGLWRQTRFTMLNGEPLEPRAMLAPLAQLVADVNTSPAGVQVIGPIVDVGGLGMFFGQSGPYGIGLWRTDGTGAGTSLVQSLDPGTDLFYHPGTLLNFGG